MRQAKIMPGVSVMTKRGVAHAGALITASMLKGTSTEFNRLLELKKIILLEDLRKSSAPQLKFDDLNQIETEETEKNKLSAETEKNLNDQKVELNQFQEELQAEKERLTKIAEELSTKRADLNQKETEMVAYFAEKKQALEKKEKLLEEKEKKLEEKEEELKQNSGTTFLATDEEASSPVSFSKTKKK